MNTINIIEKLLHYLINDHNKISLYHKNNFTLLVAVVLSARSKDEEVNKVTKKLFKIADSPDKIIKLPKKMLINIIKTLGLQNNKSKNIIKLSQIIKNKYNNKIPTTLIDLKKLPRSR